MKGGVDQASTPKSVPGVTKATASMTAAEGAE